MMEILLRHSNWTSDWTFSGFSTHIQVRCTVLTHQAMLSAFPLGRGGYGRRRGHWGWDQSEKCGLSTGFKLLWLLGPEGDPLVSRAWTSHLQTGTSTLLTSWKAWIKGNSCSAVGAVITMRLGKPGTKTELQLSWHLAELRLWVAKGYLNLGLHELCQLSRLLLVFIFCPRQGLAL